MVKYLVVPLSNSEYKVFTNLKTVDGDGGEKLRQLLKLYISTVPKLRYEYYTLDRSENKERIEEILTAVWDAYEYTDNPTENWEEDTMDTLISDLIGINVIEKISDNYLMPTNGFRNLFKILLHNIATENRDMNEFSAACMATIQLLMEFGGESLKKETIRDGTILINEEWMFYYAAAMKRARDFIKAKRLFPETTIQLENETLA